MDRLDAKDPSQNIPLLKVLNNVDRAALIDEYGYDKYASLVLANLLSWLVTNCAKLLVETYVKYQV